jgi:hypothetical protein
MIMEKNQIQHAWANVYFITCVVGVLAFGSDAQLPSSWLNALLCSLVLKIAIFCLVWRHFQLPCTCGSLASAAEKSRHYHLMRRLWGILERWVWWRFVKRPRVCSVSWLLVNAVGPFGPGQHVHTSAVKASHLSCYQFHFISGITQTLFVLGRCACFFLHRSHKNKSSENANFSTQKKTNKKISGNSYKGG